MPLPTKAGGAGSMVSNVEAKLSASRVTQARLSVLGGHWRESLGTDEAARMLVTPKGRSLETA